MLDFLMSNTILSYKNCFEYKKFYYELKKNCKGKYRFKKSFPIVETITDEMGLRIGTNSPPKQKNKENIFLFGDSFTYGVGIKFEKLHLIDFLIQPNLFQHQNVLHLQALHLIS